MRMQPYKLKNIERAAGVWELLSPVLSSGKGPEQPLVQPYGPPVASPAFRLQLSYRLKI